MGKSKLNISVDEDVIKKAKEAGINISGVVENVLKNRLEGTTTTIPREEGERCHVCGRVMPRQTKDNLHSGLVWLCPDEVWVCQSCLEFKMRLIHVAT